MMLQKVGEKGGSGENPMEAAPGSRVRSTIHSFWRANNFFGPAASE